MFKKILSMCAGLLILGCGTQTIDPTQKGRMIDGTGPLALYTGGKGFTGEVLGPGTYYTGIYDHIKVVECAQKTPKEALTALTKDGVQFGIDIYIRYSPNCDDNKSVQYILENIAPGFTNDPAHPEWHNTVFAVQLYELYIRPALGEAVRESVSPVIANDVNAKREEIFVTIRKKFAEIISKQNPKLVSISDINMSNLDFPDAMDHANTDRAVQAILKDKAIAEQEKVKAEIQTTDMRKELAKSEANNIAVKIDTIGAALKRNPEYLEYNLQAMMPDIYKSAGEKGNMVLAAPNPLLAPALQPKNQTPTQQENKK